jgi:hypothetical protein
MIKNLSLSRELNHIVIRHERKNINPGKSDFLRMFGSEDTPVLLPIKIGAGFFIYYRVEYENMANNTAKGLYS